MNFHSQIQLPIAVSNARICNVAAVTGALRERDSEQGRNTRSGGAERPLAALPLRVLTTGFRYARHGSLRARRPAKA